MNAAKVIINLDGFVKGCNVYERAMYHMSSWRKSHRYQLGCPLTEVKLQFYEQQHGVELPYEYRKFLMEVGHGGAGPIYGLFALDSRDPEFLNMDGGDLGEAIPLDFVL